MVELELTKEEIAWIKAFKRLAKKTPKTLWLFVGASSNSMAIMKTGKDGERVYGNHISGEGGGFVDQDYLVDSVRIACDGGDF